MCLYVSLIAVLYTQNEGTEKFMTVDDQKSLEHMNTEEERKSKSLVDNSITAKTK